MNGETESPSSKFCVSEIEKSFPEPRTPLKRSKPLEYQQKTEPKRNSIKKLRVNKNQKSPLKPLYYITYFLILMVFSCILYSSYSTKAKQSETEAKIQFEQTQILFTKNNCLDPVPMVRKLCLNLAERIKAGESQIKSGKSVGIIVAESVRELLGGMGYEGLTVLVILVLLLLKYPLQEESIQYEVDFD